MTLGLYAQVMNVEDADCERLPVLVVGDESVSDLLIEQAVAV